MKQFGNDFKYICFIFYVLLTACSNNGINKNVLKENKIQQDFYANYYNDSLKLHVPYFGDYAFTETEPQDARLLLSVLGLSKKKLKKHTIATLRVNQAPYFKSLIFTSLKPLFPERNWEQKINDENNGYKILKIDKKENCFYIADFQYKVNEKYVYIAIWLNQSENKDNIIKIESEQIFNSVKLGSNYLRMVKPDVFKKADELFKNIKDKGNYLKPVIALREAENLYQDNNENSYFKQALQTYNSFAGIGNEYPIKKNKKLKDKKKRLSSCNFLNDADAIQNLLLECKKNQIVMFNEAHVYPRQRYLVSMLLDSLYSFGYRVLALEALWKEPSKYDSIFPNLESGFYTREPQMANLIRAAQKIGFRLVSYEDTATVSHNRELAQANNLITSVLKQNNKEKIVVLAGGSHIKEDSLQGSKNWFAYYVKAATNINPLTVNQTAFDYIDIEKNKLRLYKGEDIRSKFGVQFGNDFYLINKLNKTDFRLFPNEKSYSHTIEIKLDTSKQINKNIILSIYLASEKQSDNSLPIWTQVLDNKLKLFEIMLPQNKYYAMVKDADGQILMKSFF